MKGGQQDMFTLVKLEQPHAQQRPPAKIEGLLRFGAHGRFRRLRSRSA